MSHAIALPKRFSFAQRMLIGFILLYSAVVLCLPVPPNEEIGAMYPWWGNRITIGNVQLHELMFLAWFALYGRGFVPRAVLSGGIPARQATICLIALAVWCGIMSLLAPLALTDLGRTFRLLLNAALLVAVVFWARRLGDFPLKALLLGFVVGTVINLVLSFRYPLIVVETMRLSGQNTAGVALGIAIHLAGWLFLHTRSRVMQFASVFVALVFLFGCAISYSRIGWFAGALGALSWAYILFMVRMPERSERRRLTTIRLVLVPLLTVGIAVGIASPLGQEGIRWISTLIEQKFTTKGDGDTNRWAYVVGTIEIVSRNPFGVGYSGFYDAMTATDTYRSGDAAEEVDPLEANPHSSFLWYTSAGGVPAAVLTLALFVMLLNSLRHGLIRALGRAGLALFACIAPPFLVIGMTVPYLFNSIILIVPAAIAAGWGWARWDHDALAKASVAARAGATAATLSPASQSR